MWCLTVKLVKRRRKTPSFDGFEPASPLSSQIKKANTNRGTSQELALQTELSKLGLRFKKNTAVLPGCPDIVFPQARLAVFCDGDFWHGRDWTVLRRKLGRGTNAAYWCAKISRNRKRDREVNMLLRKSGWRVLRIWESLIKKDPRAVALELKKVLRHHL